MGGFFAGADLIVVEHVFFPDGPGGEIGHADIGAGPDAHFPALGVDGGESRGGREEHIGEHEPDDAQQKHRQFQTARRFPAQGGVAVRNKGADAHHLRAEIMEEQQVLGKVPGGLAGGAHHEAAAHLIAKVFQIPEATHAVFQGQILRMQTGVVVGVRRFVAQEVSVRSRRPPPGVGFFRMFAHGEGDGAVGEFSLDGADDGLDALRGEFRILAAL